MLPAPLAEPIADTSPLGEPQDQIQKIRVVVVDDHPMMRDGITFALGEEPDFQVIGDGASASDAIALAEAKSPDVMLIDINMPGGGLSALSHIIQHWPDIACVVITAKEDGETVGQALRIGARGYVLKGMSGPDLARTLRTIQQGELYITPSLAKSLLMAAEPASVGASKPAGLEYLTPRENDVLEKIAQGMINKKIAIELGLTEKTVKHHVTSILQKLQVSNRVEAALIAQEGQQQLPCSP